MKKNCIYMVVGALLIITTAIIYIPKFIKQGLNGIELTFIANFITGILLIVGGLYGIALKKQLAQEYYLASNGVLLCVMLVSLFCWGEANFSGAFMFLHLINPIIVTILVLVSTYKGKISVIKTVLCTVVPTVIYIAYAIIYGYKTGDWLYSVINVQEKGAVTVLIFSVIVAIVILALEFAIYKVSKLIDGNIKKEITG